MRINQPKTDLIRKIKYAIKTWPGCALVMRYIF